MEPSLFSEQFRIVCVLLALLLCVSACSPPKPIRSGFLGGTSGRGADLGLAVREGAQLAVELKNQQGGISGHPTYRSPWLTGGATERLLELGGRAVEDITVIQTFNRNSANPQYAQYRRIYGNRFNREPGFPGGYAFDATNVLLEALAHRHQGQRLKEALLAIRAFSGVQSDFSYDDFGDVKRTHGSMSVVRNGQFEVLEPQNSSQQRLFLLPPTPGKAAESGVRRLPGHHSDRIHCSSPIAL
jgi:ABC-type branched-subunit amino acid transport system substrate-binding protein